MDYILNMAIAVVLATIKEAFDTPSQKKKIKKAMLKIRDQINLLYKED